MRDRTFCEHIFVAIFALIWTLFTVFDSVWTDIYGSFIRWRLRAFSLTCRRCQRGTATGSCSGGCRRYCGGGGDCLWWWRTRPTVNDWTTVPCDLKPVHARGVSVMFIPAVAVYADIFSARNIEATWRARLRWLLMW
jgi:hypothetical protein